MCPACCPPPDQAEFSDVAGFKANGAFNKISARSEDVAALGLKALNKGRALAIRALVINAGAQGHRLLRRALLRRITAAIKL